jgi:hypothetical protein
MGDFEVFTGRGQRASPVPTVGIQARGIFALNREAWELLGEPDAVQLLWSAATRLIGMRAVAPGAPHSYGVREKEGVYLVAGKAFLQRYDIGFAPRRLPARLEGDMLVAGPLDITAESVDTGGRDE